MKFLLDTNFLVSAIKFRIDINKELEKFGRPDLYTLNLVLKELEKLKAKKLAFYFIGRNNVSVIRVKGRTDSEIVRAARKYSMVVCTQDRELIKRLKAKNLSVVFIRQKKYLVKT